MDHCPSCNTKITKKRTCHRCKLDLGPLLDIEQQALDHQKKAINAFDSKDYEKMFFHAKRSQSLISTPKSIGLTAVSSLLMEKFDHCIALWKILDRS